MYSLVLISIGLLKKINLLRLQLILNLVTFANGPKQVSIFAQSKPKFFLNLHSYANAEEEKNPAQPGQVVE